MNNERETLDKGSEVAVQNVAAGFYENVRYNQPAARLYYRWFFEKLFGIASPKGRILDNGCGVGIVGEYLPGAEIVGVDISPKMAEYASRRLKEVRVADSQALPFADASFDTVMSLSLLHHLPDPKKGVQEVVRVLKPGGLAIFEEVVRTPLSVVPRYFLNRFSSHFSHEHKNFKRQELLNLVGSGLKVQAVQHYGYLAYALLGFPDVINFAKYLPWKKITVPMLLALDDLMQRIPFVNRWSWNIIIVAKKP